MIPKHTISLLTELRQRLRRIFWVFCGLFALAFYFATPIMHWYLNPILTHLPKAYHLIATNVTGPLFIPFYIALPVACLSIIPYGLHHLWQFAAPALHKHEQHPVGYTLITSLLLFLAGLIFAYVVILPLLFAWIVYALPQDILYMPDMGSAIHFITTLLIAFGLSFQIPLLCQLGVTLRLLSHTRLVQLRPYVIVGAFTLGMLLTPPDVLSQIILAIPLWGLYELGVWLAHTRT